MSQIDQFDNYSYTIEPSKKKPLKTTTQKVLIWGYNNIENPWSIYAPLKLIKLFCHQINAFTAFDLY